MEYVKLIAKADEDGSNIWFDAGTEVFYEDSDWVTRRMTREEYDELNRGPYRYAVFRGIRTVEDPESEGKCFAVGEKHIDGECCGLDEFEAIPTNEDALLNYEQETKTWNLWYKPLIPADFIKVEFSLSKDALQ